MTKSDSIAQLESDLERCQRVFSQLQERLSLSEQSEPEFSENITELTDAIALKASEEAGLRIAVQQTQQRLFDLRDSLDAALEEREKSEAKERLKQHFAALTALAETFNQQQSEVIKTMTEINKKAGEYSADYYLAHGSDKYPLSTYLDSRTILIAKPDSSVIYFHPINSSETESNYRQLLEAK